MTRRATSSQDDSGFVDVAANALVIVILVTLIALLLATIPQKRGEVQGDTSPPLYFPVALDPTSAPVNSYWFMTEAGLTQIALGPVASEIAASSKTTGEIKVTTDQGGFYFQNDRRSYRDLDEYRLDILPDRQAISDEARAVTPDSMADLSAQFKQSFETDRRVPTFFVTRAAMDDFAVLYDTLKQEDIALRWRAYNEAGRLVLFRSSTQFETGAATWR